MSKKEISFIKESLLNFKLDIQGTKETPKVRLNMGLGEMSLTLPGEVKEGVAIVKFPELSFLQEKFPNLDSVPARLEVFIENQYFVPWEDDLQIKKEIIVQAKEAASTILNPTPVSVGVKAAEVEPLIIKEKTKTSEKMSKIRQKMIEKGYMAK